MGRRVLAIAVLSVGVLAGTAAWSGPSAPAAAAIVCPPLTMDDLIAAQTTSTTSPSTTPPSTTPPSTTPPSSPSSSTDVTPASTSSTATTSTTATTTTAVPPCDQDFVYPMIFPILGAGDIGSPFGADRDGGRRLHAGNDIAAPKLQPVVAVADGVVTRIGADAGISGVRLHLRHHDGWSSLYIHLNNDTAGTDDGNGRGVRIDLEVGSEVEAGQVIGWVGDSGNAEDTVSHLHFELHDRDGSAVDPRPSLLAAGHLVPEDVAGEFAGPFADHEGGAAIFDPLTVLLSRGSPVWCDETAVLACAGDPATVGDAARWLEPLIGEVSLAPAPLELQPPAPGDCGGDRSCLAAVAPCGEECPVTRKELMRAIAWDRIRDAHRTRGFHPAEGIPDAAWRTPAPAPPEHAYLLDIDQVTAMLGAPSPCSPRTGLDQPLTRAETASWVLDYLGWVPDTCVTPIAPTATPTR